MVSDTQSAGVEDALFPVREESRGAHSRIDFPETRPGWGDKNNVIHCEGTDMKLRQNPIPSMPEDLKQVLAEDK